jgi:hypothetical protein
LIRRVFQYTKTDTTNVSTPKMMNGSPTSTVPGQISYKS